MSSAQAAQLVHSNIINARDFNLINKVHYTQNVSPQRDPIEILQEHVAFEALHDSKERFDPPKCHPETRTAVLDHIDQWAQDPQNGKPILWLSGAAGAGKSAIAQTLIERWKSKKLLIACFFFWRTSTRRNQKTYLIPTISFQLAVVFPAAKPPIAAVVRNGGVFEKNLASQLQSLVVEPLAESPAGSPEIIVVIDGLDECCVDLPGQDHEAQQREILEAIASVCRPSSPFRFFVASRPERQIRESFGAGLLHGYTHQVSLSNFTDAKADVRLFLNCKFAEIRKNNPGLDSSWPSEEQLSLLTDKSSGQFIYPSTVIKFVGRPRQNPQHRLEAVLELKAKPQDPKAEYPLGEIDALYSLVLDSVVPASWPIVQDVLGLLIMGMFHPPAKIPSTYITQHEQLLSQR